MMSPAPVAPWRRRRCLKTPPPLPRWPVCGSAPVRRVRGWRAMESEHKPRPNPEPASARQTHGFQAEVRELLKLMIHSLYSHREIFLRELLSNASDACDRLRFAAIADAALLAEEPELAIRIDADPSAGTLTITDNGIGMTREEAIANLGTIARSGTAEFFRSLSGDEQKASQLIGQFGVGFYSAFIVAERVEVRSRKAASARAGTRGPEARPGKDMSESEASLEYEVVNQAKALWTLPRAQISDEEYRQFYQYLAHDFTDPLAWSHNKVEGKREYISLLYLPARAPFDLWQREAARGVKLYVRRVFIMDDAEQFLPLYLRFVKGVVDSSDLPLNISREILQQDPEVEAIRSSLTKRVLDLLARLAKDEPQKYATFWKEFGAVLKEGIAQDLPNQGAILPLLRFASTHASDNDPSVSLGDYLARMKPGQERIYYVIAETLEAARASPAIERLKERGLEVLLLAERIDEWVMGRLETYEGKRFKDAARVDLQLGALASDADHKQQNAQLKESKGLLKRIKDALGERITEVRLSERLRESPACLVLGEHDMPERMRRILAAAGQKTPQARPVLEVNVEHPLLRYLDGLTDAGQFAELAQLLYEQALLTEGAALANAPEYVQRLNRLLVRLAAPPGGAPRTCGGCGPPTLHAWRSPVPSGLITATIRPGRP